MPNAADTNHAVSDVIHRELIEEQQQQRQIEAISANIAAVNLDEVAPEPVTVALLTRVPYESKNASGEPVTHYRWQTEQHEIETYVPTEIYLKAMRLQTKYPHLKMRDLSEQQLTEMLSEQQKLILEVWQLTEPEMTKAQLSVGLDFLKTQRLFTLFFGAKTQRSSAKV